MIRMMNFSVIAAGLSVLASVQTSPADTSWVEVSNSYTNKVVAVEMKHQPEAGSDEGLSQYDKLVSQPTLADEDLERQETAALLVELKNAVGQQKQKAVAQDLQIVIRKVELEFRREDFARAHKVPFVNASGIVFGGVQTL